MSPSRKNTTITRIMSHDTRRFSSKYFDRTQAHITSYMFILKINEIIRSNKDGELVLITV